MLSYGMAGYLDSGENDSDRVIMWPCNCQINLYSKEPGLEDEIRRFVPEFEVSKTVLGDSPCGLTKFFYFLGDSKEHELDPFTHCLVYFLGSKRLKKVPVMDVLRNFTRAI
jgi:hypothetical protein